MLKDVGMLEEFSLEGKGSILRFEFNYFVTSLRKLNISSFSADYPSISRWLEKNVFLEEVRLKNPLNLTEMSEPSVFVLSSLKYLKILHLQGIFASLKLSSLIMLQSLQIETPLDHLALRSFPGRCLELEELSCSLLGQGRLCFTKTILTEENIMEATLILQDDSLFQDINNVQRLKSASLQIMEKKMNKSVRLLSYMSPPECPLYLQEVLQVLYNQSNLLTLSLDFSKVAQKSLGQFNLTLATLQSVSLRSVDRMESNIVITKEAKRLKEFDLSGTSQAALQIHAPSIERVKITGLRKIKHFQITSQTGYLLHIVSGVLDIRKCPGIGRLKIEHNWSGKDTPLLASKTFYYYPQLRKISIRGLSCFSHQFFHSFCDTAPLLQQLYLSFGQLVVADGDGQLLIKHSGLKWLTILKAFSLFKVIRVDKICERLRLVKVRECECFEIINESKARMVGEKVYQESSGI